MERLLIFLVAGFVAQMIDGSLGMGFGVIGTSVLVAGGATAAAASAVIHAAKMGTAVVSGGAHWRFGNVHWRTVLLLGIPGAVGGYVGATFLASIDGDAFAPVTSVILLVLGVYMLARFAFGVSRASADPSHLRPHFLVPLGLFGGVIDAIGGGGWGPVTTPTLMTAGRMEPRTAIGSVSLAEFLVALAASIGFLTHLGSEEVDWAQVGALMLGAVMVAPFAAWIVKILPARVLGTFVAGLIIVLNARTLLMRAGAPTVLIYLVVIAAIAGSIFLVARAWVVARAEQPLLDEARRIHEARTAAADDSATEVIG